MNFEEFCLKICLSTTENIMEQDLGTGLFIAFSIFGGFMVHPLVGIAITVALSYVVQP